MGVCAGDHIVAIFDRTLEEMYCGCYIENHYGRICDGRYNKPMLDIISEVMCWERGIQELLQDFMWKDVIEQVSMEC